MMNAMATAPIRQQQVRKRIQFCCWIIIAGLVLSGITAIPLQSELDAAARFLNASNLRPDQASSGFVRWILIIRDALHDVYGRYRFIGYGTDWLAFAHIVVAIGFTGCLNHPLRNRWLFTWGMIMCMLAVPWALLFGELRGIPIGWRLIDCSFGVAGLVPCWLCVRWVRELERFKVAEMEP